MRRHVEIGRRAYEVDDTESFLIMGDSLLKVDANTHELLKAYVEAQNAEARAQGAKDAARRDADEIAREMECLRAKVAAGGSGKDWNALQDAEVAYAHMRHQRDVAKFALAIERAHCDSMAAALGQAHPLTVEHQKRRKQEPQTSFRYGSSYRNFARLEKLPSGSLVAKYGHDEILVFGVPEDTPADRASMEKNILKLSAHVLEAVQHAFDDLLYDLHQKCDTMPKTVEVSPIERAFKMCVDVVENHAKRVK